jgi:hypothetical protein
MTHVFCHYISWRRYEGDPEDGDVKLPPKRNNLSVNTISYWRILECITTPLCERHAESSWNVMAHGDAREGMWRGICRMEWVASTLHTTSELCVSSITTADAYTSAASSRLNWHPRRFKWTRPFRRKTKSGFCACAITFQKQSTQFFYFICVVRETSP